MIKVNVIVNDKTWFKYIKNQKIYIKKKLIKFKKINFLLKKQITSLIYFYLDKTTLKNLINNLGIKINPQIYCHFLFKIKKN